MSLKDWSATLAAYAIFGAIMTGIVYVLLKTKNKWKLRLSGRAMAILALVIFGVLLYLFACISVWIADKVAE